MITTMIIVGTLSLMIVLEIQLFKTMRQIILLGFRFGALTFFLCVLWYESRLIGHVNWWQLVIFAAGPWVGALMDSMPRVVAFKALCVVQVGDFVFCRLLLSTSPLHLSD